MGKPASADGGKGIDAAPLWCAHAPELPGQANRTARSPFALTRQRRLRSLQRSRSDPDPPDRALVGESRESFGKGRSDRRAEPDLQGREPDGGHPPVRSDGPGSDGPAPQGQGSRRKLQGHQEQAHAACPRGHGLHGARLPCSRARLPSPTPRIRSLRRRSSRPSPRTTRSCSIVGGALGENALDVAGVQALATLPSLDALRGKIIGLLQAPATKVAGVLQAPAGQLARVFGAYGAKEDGAKAA